MIDWTRAADATRRAGRVVEAHAEIGSTNDRARELMHDVDGVVVVSERQTAGRGRRGRTWDSPPGLNLTFSVGIRLHLAADRAGLLGIATALALRDACLPLARLAIKWPNDLVDHDGAKAAGLLLETTLVDGQLTGAVIGMGINVNWQRANMPSQIAVRATSLRDLAGREIDRVDLLRSLLTALDAELAALERGESPVERCAAVSWLDGRDVVVGVGTREVVGKALGIGPTGALLLETRDGRLALTVGEVLHVRPAGSALSV